jgi:glycosyltransferase involved in cell wall biosynthesis
MVQRVSVIVPARNAAATISDTLQSFAEQSNMSFEVIVADNGSTDGTQQIAAEFASRFAAFKLIDASQIAGPGYARRCGAEAASGELLLFVDSDDVVNRGYVEAMIAALEKHPFVHASMDMAKLNPEWFVKEQPGLGTSTATVGSWKFAYGSTIGVRRHEYNVSGGWSEDRLISEDSDLSWRLRMVGCDLTCVPEAIVHVRARHTGKAAWRQGRGYGVFQARNNRIWRPSGLPVESEWTLVPRVGLLLRRIYYLRGRGLRLVWLLEAGILTSRGWTDIADRALRRPVRAAMDVPRPDTDVALASFRALRRCAGDIDVAEANAS